MPLSPFITACGIACAGWALAHAYQHIRYVSYEAEDKAMVDAPSDTEGRAEWLYALKAQVRIGAVAPSTIDSLKVRGEVGCDLLPARELGAYVRRYDPTLSGDMHWIPAYIAAGLIGAAWSPFAAIAAISAIAMASADIRFRIVPIPHLAAFCVGVLGAFPGQSPIASVFLMIASMLTTWLIGAGVRKLGGEWGDGDSLLLGAMVAAFAGTELAPAFIGATAACSLAFIAGTKLLKVGTRVLPLAPVLAISFIITLAGGALL